VAGSLVVAVPPPGTRIRLVSAPGIKRDYWGQDLLVQPPAPGDYWDTTVGHRGVRIFGDPDPEPTGFYVASLHTGNRVGWVEIATSVFDVYDALGTAVTASCSFGSVTYQRQPESLVNAQSPSVATNPRSGRVFDTSVIETRRGYVGQVRRAHSGKIVWESNPLVDEPDEPGGAQLRARELADGVIDDAIAALFRSVLPKATAAGELTAGTDVASAPTITHTRAGYVVADGAFTATYPELRTAAAVADWLADPDDSRSIEDAIASAANPDRPGSDAAGGGVPPSQPRRVVDAPQA
jgi:hypothetical protein